MDDNIFVGLMVVVFNLVGYKIVGEIFSEEFCVIMYCKDDLGFKKVVDGVVIVVMCSGDIE